MDTQTLPCNKPSTVYVQMPADLQQIIDFDAWLKKTGWMSTGTGRYYNFQQSIFKTAKELYPLF